MLNMTWWFALFTVSIAPLTLWGMWREEFDGIVTEAHIKQRPQLSFEDFYA